jgi:two-component system C4-dicarboxylate transport response regulator DctD
LLIAEALNYLAVMINKFILIDDDAGVVLALKLLLETSGFSVEAFTKPELALAHLDQLADHSGILILCDLRMPILSGLDVLSHCSEKHPNTPIIMMSGHAEEEEIIQAMELGAKTFLSKPFSPQDVQEALKILG